MRRSSKIKKLVLGSVKGPKNGLAEDVLEELTQVALCSFLLRSIAILPKTTASAKLTIPNQKAPR